MGCVFFLFSSLSLQILATICQQMVNKSTEFSRRSLLVCFDHESLDVHVGEKRTGQENLKHSAHLEMFFFSESVGMSKSQYFWYLVFSVLCVLL